MPLRGEEPVDMDEDVDAVFAFCASDRVAVRTLNELTVLKTEGLDGQEARASFFAAKCPLGRVVKDQASSEPLQEVVSPRS